MSNANVNVFFGRLDDSPVPDIDNAHLCPTTPDGGYPKHSLFAHSPKQNAGPYTCSDVMREEGNNDAGCDKCFGSKRALGYHGFQVHGVKMFKCPSPDCTYRASRQDNLKIHQKTHRNSPGFGLTPDVPNVPEVPRPSGTPLIPRRGSTADEYSLSAWERVRYLEQELEEKHLEIAQLRLALALRNNVDPALSDLNALQD